MAEDSGKSSFQRGVASLVILGLLKQEDMYGYQLVQRAHEDSSGSLIMQEGTLYPVLYRLQEQGLISDKRVQVGKRMTRIYYHLEPAGEKKLAELIHEYEEITNGVFQIIQKGSGSCD
jgi:PadR family transcriptional regulator PadR